MPIETLPLSPSSTLSKVWGRLGPHRLLARAILSAVLALPSVGAAQTARHPEDNLRLPCAAQPNSKTIDLTGRRNYRGCQFKGNLDQPEASARAFLAHFATPLAINANQADLVLADVRRTSVSAHTRFEQQHEGVPIYGAFVQVNQGSDGSIVSLHTSYRVKRTSGSAQPGISRSRALLLAKEAAGVQEVRLAHRYRKVWFPLNTGELRIAREFWVYSADPLGDFLTVVDGETGKILFQENRIAFDVGSAKLFSPNPFSTPETPRSVTITMRTRLLWKRRGSMSCSSASIPAPDNCGAPGSMSR